MMNTLDIVVAILRVYKRNKVIHAVEFTVGSQIDFLLFLASHIPEKLAQ